MPTSKWIERLMPNIYYKSEENKIEVQEYLKNIDKLLRKAMNLVDDHNLYEEIRKEINGTN